MLLKKIFLLADDDIDDADIFHEALISVSPNLIFHTVENGKAVFTFLTANKIGIPDVIFLDINMPIMNGWDCLRKLKEDKDYKDIPAIMYSTSSAKKDIDLAYSLGAQLFVTKPETVAPLSKVLETLATSQPGTLRNQLAGLKIVKLD